MNKLNKIIKIKRIKEAFRKKKEAEKKKDNPKGETVESLRQKFYDFGARSLVFALAFLLAGCSLFTEEKVIYSTIYPSLPPLQEPNVLNLNACEWTYPENADSKVFIGMDEKNFKCYVENKEIVREQLKLYQNFVKEVNDERKSWNELNKNSKK